jgi:septal ring factor EnvC (AmiA/AmiB activator)
MAWFDLLLAAAGGGGIAAAIQAVASALKARREAAREDVASEMSTLGIARLEVMAARDELRRVWKELREAQQDILAAERREDECQRQLADLRGRIEALEAGG